MIPNRPWAALLLLAGIGLGCVAVAVAQAQTAPSPLDGRQVVAIRIVDQSGEVLDENASGLPLRLNQPFTLEVERESVGQLYRTGRYADVVAQVWTRSAGLLFVVVVQRILDIMVYRCSDVTDSK